MLHHEADEALFDNLPTVLCFNIRARSVTVLNVCIGKIRGPVLLQNRDTGSSQPPAEPARHFFFFFFFVQLECGLFATKIYLQLPIYRPHIPKIQGSTHTVLVCAHQTRQDLILGDACTCLVVDPFPRSIHVPRLTAYLSFFFFCFFFLLRGEY